MLHSKVEAANKILNLKIEATEKSFYLFLCYCFFLALQYFCYY